MSNKKQTAIEWLYEEFNNIKSSSTKENDVIKFLEKEFKEAFEQAKQLHKQEIIDAYKIGCLDSNIDGSNFYFRSEQYYKETYNLQNGK